MESQNFSTVGHAQTNVSVYGAVEETYKEFVDVLNNAFSRKEANFLGSCTPIRNNKSTTDTCEISNFQKKLEGTLKEESQPNVECNVTGQRMCLQKLSKFSSSRNHSLRDIVLVTNTLNKVQCAMMNNSLNSPINEIPPIGEPPQDPKADKVPEIQERMEWEYFSTFGLGDVYISEDRAQITVESMDWEEF